MERHEMDIQRRDALRMLAVSLGAAALPFAARAQGFPNQPITIVVPYPPGASTDQTARLVQNGLAPLVGQTVIVENKPGAAGNICAAYVAHSPPDGYRLLFATQPIITLNPHLYKDMGFDPIKDLTPLVHAVNGVIGI